MIIPLLRGPDLYNLNSVKEKKIAAATESNVKPSKKSF